jgi:simple sugar transport system ATP-binding protein
VVLRAGRVAAELPVAGTTRAHLAETMVGRPIPPTVRRPMPPGGVVLELAGVDIPGPHGRPALAGASLAVHAHEIVGIAGVSGNGQGALSDLVSGLATPSYGSLRLFGTHLKTLSPAAMVAAGVGRIPEDRHRDGVVGDIAVWENLLLEDYQEPAHQVWGIVRRSACWERARSLIAAYDVKTPGPGAATRLLSGGNIQKLILGRVQGREPAIILANQPTRGLDVGAVTYVHQRLLEARTRGAGILLISEDLDEILALADRVAVLFRGHLTPTLPIEGVTIRALGLMMAGHEAEVPGNAA